MPIIKAALIDLSGTLHIDDEPTTNAVEALQKLRQSGIKIKFVTNTTKESKETLCTRLRKMGFQLQESEIYSSLTAAAKYVETNKLNPFYLLTNDAKTDFPDNDSSKRYDSVVVGLSPGDFHYEHLNKAFRILIENKDSRLVAINQSKYFKRKDGLAIGAGFFVKGLEFSTGIDSVLIGKPNLYFFKSAIPEDTLAEECIMIGDDYNDDIAGAMNVGCHGILVKTGKYLPTISTIDPAPTAVLDNFSAAVEWIITNKT